MTKQAMAELVHHLEDHAYLTRSPTPPTGAKLVLPTDRGREVITIAQELLVPELEGLAREVVGSGRVRALHDDP